MHTDADILLDSPGDAELVVPAAPIIGMPTGPGGDSPGPGRRLGAWLDLLWQRGGTDLLLTADSPPRMRVDGDLRPMDGEATLCSEEVREIALSLLDQRLIERLAVNQDVDLSFSWRDVARLRGNAYMQRGVTSLALRMIPSRIPTFSDLALPAAIGHLADLPRGLLLVTGPTGSGKTTTLASMIDHINEQRAAHILTIEDPIEYMHGHKRSAVDQREVGADTPSFEQALRAALREDPDVVLVGEMRDLESIRITLTLAETGHLVLATLHTNDAPQALDRIIDVFSSEQQAQIRSQLASSLGGVVAQRLLPKIGGGLVASFEVLVATGAVRSLLREGKTHQLRNVMTTSRTDGMQTMELCLAELLRTDTVTYEAAAAVSLYPAELERRRHPRPGASSPAGG